MYHNRLGGYQPTKTGRICLHLRDKKIFEKPDYAGAICNYDLEFDFAKYNSIESKADGYKFILDSIHKTILEMAHVLNWDKEVFIKSYNSILRDNFEFIKVYPQRHQGTKKPLDK